MLQKERAEELPKRLQQSMSIQKGPKTVLVIILQSLILLGLTAANMSIIG